MRIILTASAPLHADILKFLKVAFCCPVVEAYGMTESAGASCSTCIYDNEVGHVGGIKLGCELKLESVPELDYYINGKEKPQGEVCMRGYGIFKGYFKNK